MTVYEIRTSYHRPPLNANDRIHWGRRASITRDLRGEAFQLAILHRLPRGCDHATITLVYCPPDLRGRDEGNIAPTLKPLVDGLVGDYGLCPNDTHVHVQTACEIGPVSKPGRVLLRIETES